MATNSHIEWTEATWNPLTGCTKISPGCKLCYAERLSRRLRAMGQQNYVNGFELTLHEHVVDLPLGWKKPRTIFVNSMSDLFHKDVPVDFVQRVFNIMNRANWHIYQILTKRSERLREIGPSLTWGNHIWMGVSVENSDYTFRIEDLRKSGADVKFISFEPLIGPISDVDLSGIDWAIVGGESGPKARPMQPDWARSLRAQCRKAHVPFFFKQWGGVQKSKTGRVLDGRTWDAMPNVYKKLIATR
jgi:protein gp37